MRKEMIESRFVPNPSRSAEDRDAHSYDFGRMTRRVPSAVARPESVEEVSSTVRRAAADGTRIAIRGGGHSQGGQSLTDGGLVVDTTRLDRVRPLGRDLVRAQGGALWGQVVDALHGTRTLPRVLVDVAEVTVGGTLSAGGLGTTSHRYGMQVDQVEQLEVVTGAGEPVRCSRSRNADLFDAVRGGQGQFGIITEAWIRLRRCGERLRQYELRYRDPDRFAHDFERMVGEDRVDRLRAETRVHDREVVMGAGVEHDGDHDDGQVLEGLGHDEIVSIRETAHVARAGMYPRWAFSRRNYHPWRDWFLPWAALRTVLTQPWLDPRCVPRAPRSWIGIYPIGTGTRDSPLLMVPEGDRMFSYSILSVLDEYGPANELVETLEGTNGVLAALGGKRYLSGGVRYGRREWEEHFGEALETGLAWKREFDPKGVFRWAGMPFDESPAAPAWGIRE